MPLNSWTNSKDWLVLLLQLFAFFLPFVRIFYFPVVSAKIQPTEIIFLLMLPLAFLRYKNRLFDLPRPWLIAAMVYLAANLFSGFYSGEIEAILESFGRVYLVVLTLIIAAFVRYEDRVRRRAELLIKSWSLGGVIMASLTLVAIVAAALGWDSRLVVLYEDYPYFGTVIRAKGLTGGANSLVYVSLLPLLYLYRRVRMGRGGLAWFALLMLICLATISKELVLVLLGLLLVDPYVTARFAKFQLLAIVVASLTLWFGTHYIVQRPKEVTGTYLEGTEYTSERIVYRNESFQLLETSYTALKRAGLIVAAKHPLAGVGPGKFGSKLPVEKALGNYPSHLPDYDPHSTWIGGFSETGILGGISLLILTGLSFWYTRTRLFAKAIRESEYHAPIRVYLLLVVIASISVDIMNFRHIWVPLGILLGLASYVGQPKAHKSA